ncbi:MAG: sensor histidine kinase [Tateyamaria sp.]
MPRVLSLRGRLTAIILVPLMGVAVAVGLWQLNNARQTATDVFDKRLLVAALAVANDVAISGGDALSPRTGNILTDTSGGPMFYHVYAPDGVIVAGYATPPVGIPRPSDEASAPNYFQASYLGRSVRGVRLQNRTQIDGFAGVFTTTVWQYASVRTAFVRDLVMRAMLAIAGMIAALALIVWFGVRYGLRPLTDLESAIASRTSDELSPIKRAVPVEVAGIVTTLNRLFGQVTQSMTAQSEFISNAAHQLRNPIAGVLSLAEAVNSAPDFAAAKGRAEDLLEAAEDAATLSQQLLLLERARTISPATAMQQFDLHDAFSRWATLHQKDAPMVHFTAQSELGEMYGDKTMIREALRNLIDNALRHGGSGLSRIDVTAVRQQDDVVLSVRDDGVGLSPDAVEAAKTRFQTVAATSGSGLGLSIAEAVAIGHGGEMEISPSRDGLTVSLRLRAA